jgi:hypothetical protein
MTEEAKDIASYEPAVFDVYCDESCHLEHDGKDIMVLGAISLPDLRKREIAERLAEIKVAHGLPRAFEAKWTKVSPAQVDLYLALIDAFFDDPDLRFRGLVARGKDRLRHNDFNQDHDTWYYKMYWQMLNVAIRPPSRHRIYLDIKDSRGGAKAEKLRDVLANTYHDWFHQIVERIQIVRSDEIAVLQLTDLLVGALSYRNRGLSGSTAKQALIQRIEDKARVSLDRTTALNAWKFNVFHWDPQPSE